MKKKSLYIILSLFILAIIIMKTILVDDIWPIDKNIPSQDKREDILAFEEVEIEPPIEEEPIITDIDILAVGDIMFHMPQIKSADIGQGVFDFNPMFNYVRDYIQAADISIGNYETVTNDSREYSGFPRFNSPPETIMALKETGFDILSTANNHSLDQGKAGIISTIEAINRQGIKHIGTNLDKNTKPLVVEKEGIKIGFLSYTFGLNGLDSLLSSEELDYMVNLIDEEKIQNDIQILKSEDVDLIVSYIHWGHEYHHQPSKEQMDLGRDMVDWGINIVFGSHPHLAQKSELISIGDKDNLIVYSMGNFISNQRETTMGNPYTEDGVMVKVNIEKDFDLNKTRIKQVEYIPTWVYRYNEAGKYSYKILATEEIVNGKLDIEIDANTRNRIEESYSHINRVYSEDKNSQ